jgi:transcriptional regulator with XRE-family HTH domain
MMPRDHRQDFGTLIAIHREESGLVGTKVAAPCGVTQSEYSNWERSKSLPETEHQVRNAAIVLNINQDWLVKRWNLAKQDWEKKGPPIVTRTYDVTSKDGGGTTDAYGK